MGSGSLIPCQCAESWILEQDSMGMGRSLTPWLGGCREEPGSWKGHEEALELFAEFLLCLKFSLQPNFFLQIYPGIYCFSFLLPAPDFWTALPQERAFGRLRGSCHASKHLSGMLPASRWIRPGPIPSRAAPRPVACAVTWAEPQRPPHPWQGADTSCLLSCFQRLRREHWMGSRLFLALSLQGLPFVRPTEGTGQGGPGGGRGTAGAGQE